MAIAMINLWSQDVRYRRLGSLEKLVSLNREVGDLDERLKRIIRFEIDAEAKSRYKRRGIYAYQRRWFWIAFVPITLCSVLMGSFLWILDVQDKTYFIESYWELPPKATEATVGYLYIFLCVLVAYALWGLFAITVVIFRKRKGQFIEHFIDRSDS